MRQSNQRTSEGKPENISSLNESLTLSSSAYSFCATVTAIALHANIHDYDVDLNVHGNLVAMVMNDIQLLHCLQMDLVVTIGSHVRFLNF